MSATEVSPPAGARAPALARKVAFLSTPQAYPDEPRQVEAIETHLSWVFLTDRHAWKLKKPQRLDHHDLSTVAAREHHCRIELRLNRRLAGDVYLDVVPLFAPAPDRLSFTGRGEPVEWLLKMRRLPREIMLDSLLRGHELRRRDLRRLLETLARFYRMCAPEPLTGAHFRARIAGRIAENTRELARFPLEIPEDAAAELAERQLAFMRLESHLIDGRVDAGLIVEGHGDLRPEHICLETEPRIIDCLEFSRELRIVDPAGELGFLALECERLGAEEPASWILPMYSEISGDLPDPRLVHFYQSVHACTRARLAMWHLLDPASDHHGRWPPVARRYLDLAATHLDALSLSL
jgi:aminoglycoside phosphotransferase family enzyme